MKCEHPRGTSERSLSPFAVLAIATMLLAACSGEAGLAVPATPLSSSVTDSTTPPSELATVPTSDDAGGEPSVSTSTSTVTATETSGTPPLTVAWKPLTDDSRILIIGDSISVGYTPFVMEELGHPEPQVIHNEGNAQSTNYALSSNRIYDWIGDGNWDVIYFNFGLHDLSWADQNQAEVAVGTEGAGPRVPLDQYEAQLQEIVDILRQTDAYLIFATTTPVYATAGSRVAGAEIPYNEVAVGVMERNGVRVSDLHSFALATIRVNQLLGGSDNIHFNASGYEALSAGVLEALETPPAR